MSSCRKPECPGAHGEGGTRQDPDHVVVHSHPRRNGREILAEEDFALRPLTTFLDNHGDGVYGYRLSGKWYLRVSGVTGTGRTFAEASADAMNKVMAVGT